MLANVRYVSTWVTRGSLEINIKSPLHANEMQLLKLKVEKLTSYKKKSREDVIEGYKNHKDRLH